ncbi:alpha/beta fold hydrolase [Clavibacter tessellarius]|uniref:alpha/beta fold hydrolase n=1 Tax=Clavibacter tessellarius TaxID=31965 RepID=UPI00324BA006
MFRHLIPALAGRFRVIAPDHLGFGRSSAPSVDDVGCTFAALADMTGRFLAAIGVSRYAIYVQDYGAPVGWRLALADPAAVTGVITQNGNAYEEGFVPSFWDPIWADAAERTDATRDALRPALGREAVEWQYTHGVPDPSVVDPDAWEHDLALLARPGQDDVQLALFRDYATNRELYPAVHAWLRESRVPLLVIWGRNDEIFAAAGAEAFRRDAPHARIEARRRRPLPARVAPRPRGPDDRRVAGRHVRRARISPPRPARSARRSRSSRASRRSWRSRAG